jgi:PAS domain-containing protein
LYGGVLLVTNDGVVEFANQAFCDLFDLEDHPGKLIYENTTCPYANLHI